MSDQLNIEQTFHNPSVTRAGVTVYTWGSKDSELKNHYLSEVIEHVNDIYLRSHNPGHASLLLTLSDTEENRELVKSKLEGTNIPCEYKKYDILRSGKPYVESVIEIYFSFWPGVDNTFVFNTYVEDLEKERLGIHVDYNINRLRDLNPEITPEVRIRREVQPKQGFNHIENEIYLGFNSSYFDTLSQSKISPIVKSYQKTDEIFQSIDSIKHVVQKIGLPNMSNKMNNAKHSLSHHYKSLILKFVRNSDPVKIKELLEKKIYTSSEMESIAGFLKEKIKLLEVERKWSLLATLNCILILPRLFGHIAKIV